MTTLFETFSYLFHVEKDITGLKNTVAFTTNNQTECFVITYTDDNIYELQEGLSLTVNTSYSGLFVGAPSSTVLLITDNDCKYYQ